MIGPGCVNVLGPFYVVVHLARYFFSNMSKSQGTALVFELVLIIMGIEGHFDVIYKGCDNFRTIDRQQYVYRILVT